MRHLFFILALCLQFIFTQQLLAQSTPAPTPDEFVDVEVEPKPLVPIEDLIVYPEVAKRSGLQGKVTVQILIEKDGSVSKVEVLKSDYDVFKAPAINAMKRARFSPAMNQGVPLRIWVTRIINFKIRGADPVQIDPADFRRFGRQIGISLDSARSWIRAFGQVEEIQQESKILLRATAKPDSQRKGGVATKVVTLIVGDSGVEEATTAIFFNSVEYATLMIGRSERREYDKLEPGVTYHVIMDPSNRIMSYRARRQ